MAKKQSRNSKQWRDFELLVAKIEGILAPQGAIVKSPDKVPDYSSKRNKTREVDTSIRYKIGTVEILITIECRARSRVEDLTWIEQLSTKKKDIRASD
jgi:hypothetical protein